MVYELRPEQFEMVRPLFKGLSYNLVIDSVIDGNTRGQIWVDDPQRPRVACLWNKMDAVMLAGFAGNEHVVRALNQVIMHEMIPDARKRYVPGFSLFYAPGEWQEQIDLLLRGANPVPVDRRYYQFKELRVDWRAQMPVGCRMQRIDGDFLANRERENMNHVIGWIRSFWHTEDAFVRDGVGYCLLQGETIASWCLSVFVSGDRFEFGVETVADQRQKNFATLVAAACVDYCASHKLNPLWHCEEANRGSIAVAEKVGFEHMLSYSVYAIEFDRMGASGR